LKRFNPKWKRPHIPAPLERGCQEKRLDNVPGNQ
jgi:hypothetical protein